VASCVRQAEAGMVVRTASERCVLARKLVTELLLADHPTPCAKQQQFGTCDLENLGAQLGLGKPRFPATRFLNRNGGASGPRPSLPHDLSSAVIAVDHSACILCDRCIRACDDLQVN